MIGFSIRPITRRVDPATVEKFRTLPVANISDCMSRMTASGPRLRPMHAEGVLAGPAFTVKTRPGDNLLVHKALDTAAPGDIVVVDAGGDLTNAIIGEIMMNYAISRGLAGFVINGAIRDIGTIRRQNWPVFAAGITHRGPYKDGPGEIGLPISIDGMSINPGDLIIGDEDGLLCVPFEQTERVLKDTLAGNAREEKTLAAIASGAGMDRKWVDDALTKLGCEFVEKGSV